MNTLNFTFVFEDDIMNIKGWSDLIYRYYFESGVREKVVLHISMQDLIDFAKEEDVEVINGKRASSYSDEDLFRNFVQRFWIGQNGNADMRDLAERINQLSAKAEEDGDYRILLSILAILIMPICENDALLLNGNNYYGHLRPFLVTHGFVNAVAQNDLLASIKLDEIWGMVNRWAEENALPFHSPGVVVTNGTRQFVRSLMRESILSPSKLQRFCVLFDLAGLVPKINIEDDRLLSAFTNYYSRIGISAARYGQLTSNEFRDSLLSALRSEYNAWDGTTRIKERDRRTGNIKVEAGNTCYPLLLHMDYDVNSGDCSFGFQLYCSDIDDFEYLNFISDSDGIRFPSVYIKNDGFANLVFSISEQVVDSLFSDRRGVYCIHEEDDSSLKGRHVVTDYYLLRLHKNRYIATNEFVKGEFYFTVIRHEAINDFTDWLDDNDADLISDNALGGNYSVYRIEHAAAELPIKSSLRFKSEIRCKSVNNLEVKTDSDTDIVFLSDLLPAQFEITGVDVTNDRIEAKSVNSPQRYSSALTYDHQKGLWVLKVFTHCFQRQTPFQIFHNEAPIPYGKTYMFKKFSIPTRLKELSLDQWGDLSESPLSKGLELPPSVIGKNLINWTTLKYQMQRVHVEPFNQGTYWEKDYLLYAITSASFETSGRVITTQWLREIGDRIASEYEGEGGTAAVDKYSLSNALADYFRMGYINYAYTEKGLYMTANRPTLILLTPFFKRTVVPGFRGMINCEEREYKCLLTGGRTIELVRSIEKRQQSFGFRIEYKESSDILQPQTIYIHAAERSVFKALAEKCGLLYQDNIYSNALLESLPTVADYIAFKKTHGKERDLSAVPSRRVIDYAKMAEIYPEKRARGQAINNSEIDKEDFNPDSDVVTFFPGSRDETTIMVDDGRMVEIDKYWGHFVGMYKADVKVLQYDLELAQISLPQQFRLPLLYARALTLLTGTTPDSVWGSRTYSIGVNPFTFGSKPEAILNKLGQ